MKESQYSKFSRALRGLGFEKAWDTKAGGERTTQFEKQIDDRRRVEVQLWGSGQHRATHSFKGCSDTRPTDFTTINGMIVAIKTESTRMDGKFVHGVPSELALL